MLGVSNFSGFEFVVFANPIASPLLAQIAKNY